MFTTTVEESPPWEGLPVAIDGDEIAYVAAAGNEVRKIRVREKVPFSQWQEFNTRTEFYSNVGGKKNAENFVIEDLQLPFKLEKCFEKVDEAINSILSKCKTEDYQIYIGKGSPRDHIATVQVYKGNRSDMLRPLQLKAARDYLVSHWGAIDVDGNLFEADDMLAIKASEGWIQATQDKDANQVCGWLLKPTWEAPKFMEYLGYFDVEEKETYKKPVGEGVKFLAAQCLFGDDSDNYKPTKLSTKTCGLMKAKKVLAGCSTEAEVWEAVAKAYQSFYPSPVTFAHAYTGEELTYNWADFFNEYYCLAKMKESLNEITNGYEILERFGLAKN